MCFALEPVELWETMLSHGLPLGKGVGIVQGGGALGDMIESDITNRSISTKTMLQ